MRYFTPAIDKYLAYWIMPDTWHTPPDIEDRFYGFVCAFDRYSPRLRDTTRNADDLSLQGLSSAEKTRQVRQRTLRNPRTYRNKEFAEKVLLAIQRNHPAFDKELARSLVEKLTENAMLILDALWYSRKMPANHIHDLRLINFK